jgi:uncharacterized repeat protein (TIGR01451 family)
MPRMISRVLFTFLLFSAVVANAADVRKGRLPQQPSPGVRTGVNGAVVPLVQTIAGNPLTIVIGSDTAFQVTNSAFPGQGQIYPGSCTTPADAGIFAHVNGTYFSPNLNAHPCGTAGDPGTPWTEVSISPVTGTGTSANPFTVTVVVDAGTTGVRLTATYTYVNGENFFRITKTFCATSAATLRAFLGADIYLAGSDQGIPYLEPTSQSPGGQDCGGAGYTILMVPTTPATAYSSRSYSTVWSEIQAGNLSNIVSPGCQDNGSALQWNRNIAAGACATVTSAVSFGAIPGIALFRVDSVTPAQGAQGQTLNVVVTGVGFQAGTTFNFGAGITVNSTVINSSTQATLNLTIAPTAAIGFRNVTGTQSPGGLTHTLVNGFEVTGAVAGADLSVTKTASPTTVDVGSNVSFTITVANAGPASASTVVVTDAVPANLTYVSSSSTAGTCSAVGNTVTCQVGTLAAGANAVITINATANASGAANNTATVTSATGDPNAANNSGAATVTVSAVISTAVPTLDFWATLLLAGLLLTAAMFTVFRN